MPEIVRILGIDPGSRVTGYGIIDSDGRDSRCVGSGLIRTDGLDFPERLGRIHAALTELIAAHRPAQAAVEQVFMARNAASALKLGQARGAALAALVGAGLPVHEYSPRTIKQALVGSGAAGKPQVGHMVGLILGVAVPAAEDESDALAVAICHAHSHTTQRRLGAPA